MSRRQGNGSDRCQSRFTVRVCRLVFSVQEALQALLYSLTGSGTTWGVDKLWIQVEGTRRGPVGEQTATTGLEAGLQDLTQLW